MIYFVAFLAVWVATSVITYGAFLGYYQRAFHHVSDYDYGRDVRHALFMSVAPFAGLIVALILNRFEYGLKYRK